MSMNDDIKNILVSEEALKAKVAELGAQISRDYEGRNLVLVSILKGSVVFMADLMRAVTIPCSIDFMVVSSYGGSNTTTSGLVKIIKDLDGDLSGKDVLIVEDILDTGVTLSKLVPMLKMRNPNSVKICTILDKPSRRKADIQPSEGKNCILNRRPYKIEQDPDKYIDKCGNNRHKPGTAEKGKSIGKQNLMEPVMKGRYPQTHDNSPKHTHLKCLYSAHAGNSTFQHIRGDASVRKYFPRDLQYCTD